MEKDLLGIELFGKMNAYDKSKEFLEVNKLAKWSKITAHEKDVYKDVLVEFLDNNNKVYDTIHMKNGFVIEYRENYEAKKGNGEFYAFIRQFDDELKSSGGLSQSYEDRKTSWNDFNQTTTATNKNQQYSYVAPVPSYPKGIPSIVEETKTGDTTALSTEKNKKQFVIISDKASAYGGDQEWFTSVFSNTKMEDTGCGPVAVTNIIYYYAQNMYFGKYLLNTVKPTMAEFITYAAVMYEYYTPQTLTLPNKQTGEKISFGVWYIDTVSEGVLFLQKEKT